MSKLTEAFDKPIHPNEVRERLWALEEDNEELRKTVSLLMDITGLLAREANIRIDKAKANK